jgi:hypothetical protein
MNEPAGDRYPLHWPRIGAAVAVAALAGFLVWLLVIRDGGDNDNDATPGRVVDTAVAPFGPALAGPTELRDAAGQLGHDVYWAGEGVGGDVELTLTGNGRAFVRYLTGNAEPGEDRARYLTVATYKVKNAQAVLEDVAGREGRESFPVPGGGLAVVNQAEPERVYFTPDDAQLQVEVFDPEEGQARALVADRAIVPIG